MRVLITGASGFIGSFILEQNYPDIIFRGAYRNESSKLESQSSEVTIVGNIDTNTNWEESLKDVDAVIHSAGRAHIMEDKSKDSLDEYLKVNTEGTLNLAEQCLEFGVKRFLFMSTAKVNGESSSEEKPFRASDKPNPEDEYSTSKYYAEKGLLELSESKGLSLTIIRPGLVYGPNVKANFLSLMNLVKVRLPLPLGSINNSRSFISIYNLTDIIMRCLESPSAVNKTFLVSDDEDLSTKELIIKMSISFGKKPLVFPFSPMIMTYFAKMIGREDLILRLCESFRLDITETKNILNWKPVMTVEQSLIKMTETIKENKNSVF